MARIKPTIHYKATKVNGERVLKPMTRREVKAYIMKVNNWTAEQYRKQYDIFKNKMRAYEALQEAGGYKAKKQSVSDVLYYTARAKEREGAEYKPSKEMEKILSMSAYSITKGRKYATQQKYLNKQYDALIKKDFGEPNSGEGLLNWAAGASTPLAQKIMKLYNDGIDRMKVHQGISKIATELEKLERRNAQAQGVRSDSVGSDEITDVPVDIAPYLG